MTKNIQKSKAMSTDILHIFIFSSFAVAQPIYDLLSKYADFFVAHNAHAIDISILIFTLSIVFPSVFAFTEILAGLVNLRIQRFTHLVLTMMFVTIFAMQLLKKTKVLPDATIIYAAITLGIAISLFYQRKGWLKNFVSFLAPAIVLFPIFFLFFTPVKNIVFPKEVTTTAVTTSKSNAPPIIFVIFDELPLVSLLDEEHQIDPIRYPNIAGLAKKAFWFRNYTVNSPYTTISIPMVLSGQYSSEDRMMTAEAYPESLFTLLGNSYSIHAMESIGEMVPRGMNKYEKNQGSILDRTVSEMLDIAVVFIHIALPESYTKSLPTITQNWGGFVEFPNRRKLQQNTDDVASDKDDRHLEFKKFINMIGPSAQPGMYFLHILLPHLPWEYTPSGRRYNGRSLQGLDTSNAWINDEMLVMLGYQRHLLQLGFVDLLVGDLISHLKQNNLFDTSMIILTSDHGCVFKPNQLRRAAPDYLESDSMPVPLIMKLPNQKEGVVSDENIEAIDVVPSIADVLDLDVPWKTDGSSIFDKSRQKRSQKTIITGKRKDGYKRIHYPPQNNAKYTSLASKLSYFGSGRTQPDGLYQFGPNKALINRELKEFEIKINSTYTAHLEQNSYAMKPSISGESYVYPCNVSGTISKENHSINDDIDLAISVNGVIKSTTRSYKISNSKNVHFNTILSDDAFIVGENNVEVYVISKSTDGLQLEVTNKGAYSLGSDNTISLGSKSLPIIPKEIYGYVDRISQSRNSLLLLGWTADVKKSKLVDSVVVFLDGKLVSVTGTNIRRGGVAKIHKNNLLLHSGFSILIPSDSINDDSEIRIFAISDGIASELTYAISSKYFKK